MRGHVRKLIKDHISGTRRSTSERSVSWARRCVYETVDIVYPFCPVAVCLYAVTPLCPLLCASTTSPPLLCASTTSPHSAPLLCASTTSPQSLRHSLPRQRPPLLSLPLQRHPLLLNCSVRLQRHPRLLNSSVFPHGQFSQAMFSYYLLN